MIYLLNDTPNSYRGEGRKRYHQRYGRPSWRPDEEEDFEVWVEDSILHSMRLTLPCLNKSVVEASGFGLIRRNNVVVVPLSWEFRDGSTAWTTVTRSRESIGYHIHWEEAFNVRLKVDGPDGRPLGIE